MGARRAHQRFAAASLNALSPACQRLRVSGEDEEMTEGLPLCAVDATADGQGGHRHSFDASLKPRSKTGFTCVVCKEKKLAGRLRRPCI
ncbi:hypothetical protein DIPPA_18844 [Diplonema papillatum]|nr:hypothetical protein DIPPA_18844 [Diplonema papillatum]